MDKKPKTVKEFTPELMKMFAELIKTTLPDGVGFSLIFFDLNLEETHFKYISNAPRADMLKSLRELLKKWETDAAKHN